MRKTRFTENQLLAALVRAVGQRLPATWSVELDERRIPDTGADARLRIRPPDGSSVWVLIEVKSQMTPQVATGVAEQLSAYDRALGEGIDGLLAAAPYLSPRTREALVRRGIGYFDLTGNLRLAVEEPPIVLEAVGEASNPWSEGRPLRSLKGAAAGRLVRTLADFAEPYTLTRLSELASVSIPSAYRVVSLLEAEGLLRREPRGPVEEVDWQGLIRRWAQDYSLTDSNRVVSCLEPRGALAALEKLADSDTRHAVTGPLATSTVAPSVPGRLAAVFVDDPEGVLRTCAFREVERGANVMLLEPYDEVVYERAWAGALGSGEVTYAALSQVAVDLLTGPGRSPVGADELLAWMQENERGWRRAT